MTGQECDLMERVQNENRKLRAENAALREETVELREGLKQQTNNFMDACEEIKYLQEELRRQWFTAHSSECENLNYGEHTGECTWPMPKILEEK